MWRAQSLIGSYTLCLILGLGVLSPGIAVACEGATEESVTDEFIQKEEPESELMTDFTFPAVGDVMRWTLDNADRFENLTVGTLSLAGVDRTLFNLEEAANCNGVVLRPNRANSCTVKVKLENGAAKEAEALAPGTYTNGDRVTVNKLLHH
ncbi:MAG TPA: hypothetical protein VN889_03035 [Solirubrobacteraceae bacterium]|nr:hypothetical protein [Solirubrobacteraceae bacterium]